MISLGMKRLAVGGAILASIVFAISPSLADTRYTSKSGNLIVQYGKKCSTVKPSGFYRVGNAVTGNLTPLDCSVIGGDIAEHKFIDMSGKERCYGQMRQVWSRKIVTIWKIEGAVSGYPCTQVGKTFTIEMDGGKQI